ncbi:MAG: hypothetical protein MK008_13725 [Bdellovibrionales bacterium]|nr:hypothetical protein [Bdellovibrionales bacterium]
MFTSLFLMIFGLFNQASACQMEALIIAEISKANHQSCEFKVKNFSYYAPSTLCPLSKSQIKSSGIYVPGHCKHLNEGEFIQGVVFYKKGIIQLDR